MQDEERCRFLPLFNLPLSVFGVAFERASSLPADLCQLLRGQVGRILREQCCVHEGDREVDCCSCALFSHCGYQVFFRPLPPGGQKSPPVPFTISWHSDNSQRVVQEVQVVLFGPADQQRTMFLDVLVHGLEALRKKATGQIVRRVLDVYPLMPLQCQERKTILADCLEVEWHYQRERWCTDGLTEIRCLSPLVLGRKGAGPFIETLVLTAIDRLRDLKRFYGNDTDMGKTGAVSVGSAIEVDNNLHQCRAQRYSHAGGRLYRADGICGHAVYRNLPAEILLLCRAAGIVHVGQDTSWGNGKVSVKQI